MAESKNSPSQEGAEPPPLKPGVDSSGMNDASNLPSPLPHDGGYPPVERRAPMQQDENGNDIGPGSRTHTGASGHKGR